MATLNDEYDKMNRYGDDKMGNICGIINKFVSSFQKIIDEPINL